MFVRNNEKYMNESNILLYETEKIKINIDVILKNERI